MQVVVAPDSERLQLLEPFAPWDGTRLREAAAAAQGARASARRTTSRWPARGCASAATSTTSATTCSSARSTPSRARPARGAICSRATRASRSRRSPAHYKAEGLRWVVVGDENYGEGTSREHAAMTPRLLGAAAVIVRSFARIHESNLKKQGVLPLTFADPGDYEKVQEGDRVSVLGLTELAPGRNLPCRADPRGRERGCVRGRAHPQRRADRLVPGRLGAESAARAGRRVTRGARFRAQGPRHHPLCGVAAAVWNPCP